MLWFVLVRQKKGKSNINQYFFGGYLAEHVQQKLYNCMTNQLRSMEQYNVIELRGKKCHSIKVLLEALIKYFTEFCTFEMEYSCDQTTVGRWVSFQFNSIQHKETADGSAFLCFLFFFKEAEQLWENRKKQGHKNTLIYGYI